MFRVICKSISGKEEIMDFADVEEAINVAERANDYACLKAKVVDEYGNTIADFKGV